MADRSYGGSRLAMLERRHYHIIIVARQKAQISNPHRAQCRQFQAGHIH